jgi:hypothetical protein
MRPLPLLAALALLAAAARPAAAQVTVSRIRDLDFGPVIRGIATHVGPSDPVKSGEFQFTAAIGSRVRVRFTLPNRLNGPAGATMPISFGTTDAIATGTAPSSVPVTFNPNVAQTFNIVTSTVILVFIGGTVTPAGGQALGTYTNTITLTITLL